MGTNLLYQPSQQPHVGDNKSAAMLTIPMDLEVDAQQRSDIKEELHDNGVLQVRMLYMTE